MFQFCSLYSGSSGNCSLVQTSKAKILIDCGQSAKKIVDSLSKIDIDISDIDAILVTHEHLDHVKSMGTLSKKYNIPIYATEETIEAMPEQTHKIEQKNINTFELKKDFSIGDLQIHPFSIPHDAANPVGFNIIHKNKKISIATDIGHITPEILKNLEKSVFLLLEANYEPNVLKCSPYPYYLKERISGPNGHLSNYMAAKTVSHLLNYGLENALLGHLSKENNFPELAYKTVADEIIFNNHLKTIPIKLGIAPRDCSTPIINIS